MSDTKRRIYVIAGPTASGKSSLAMRMCEVYPFEIVSMDSMQIYRGMDIGTAKPSKSEREAVRHHMIDIADPHEAFSCADYVRMAKECVEDIYLRNKLPLFVGGTGLYLDGLMYRNSYEDYEKGNISSDYRRELTEIYEKKGADFLHGMLMESDPEAAESIHKNNVKRVMRALEIIKETGKTKTESDRESRREEGPFDVRAAVLSYPDREVLYERINRRVDEMMEQGLLFEVRHLYDKGLLTNGSTASAAIGYKEFILYFKGEAELSSCVELLKQSTRRYAKRQLTWFGRYKDIYQIDMSRADVTNIEEIVNFCKDIFFVEM